MKKLFFLLLLFHSLYSDDPDTQSATEGDPSTICDFVSLLTGDFILQSEDIVVNGTQPLHITRSYVSRNGTGENGGWEFFPHLKMILLPHKYLHPDTNKHHDYGRRISIRDANGTHLMFKRDRKIDLKKAHIAYSIDFEKNGKGISNTAKGVISGRTSLRNYRLCQETENRICLYTANDIQRIYKRTYKENDHPIFLLKQEVFPNGNNVFYVYDSYHRLKYLYSTNAIKEKTYAYCKFHYTDSPNKSHDVRIETSDGRNLIYSFMAKGKSTKSPRFFLQNVTGAVHRPETFQYDVRKEYTYYTVDHLVNQQFLPNGKTLQVEYYPLQYPYSKYSAKLPRVKTLFQPMGENNALIPTHQFSYHDESHVVTTYDANDNKTTLYHSSQLPCEIRYHEKDTLHHYVQMHWGNWGQLSEKIILDSDSTPLIQQKYHYDNRGNVLQEELIGNICSLHSTDTHYVSQKFNKHNLLVEKIESSGLITRITYLDKKPFIKTKIITDNQNIHLRELYTYNKDNLLIEKIIDDGISDDPHDFTYVTTRKIERYQLKRGPPAEDLPEVIEEFALDPTTGEEILIKKTHLHYNQQARVIQQDTYTKENTLSHSLFFSYDLNRETYQRQSPPSPLHNL